MSETERSENLADELTGVSVVAKQLAYHLRVRVNETKEKREMSVAERSEDLADELMGISIVAKQLAKNLRVRVNEMETEHVFNRTLKKSHFW